MTEKHTTLEELKRTMASFLGIKSDSREDRLIRDFNDPVHPARIFSEQAGFRDVFTTLGLCAPVTFPCPYLSSEGFLVEAIDKIMTRGNIKPVLASSPQYTIPGGVLSDHWPVAAVLDVGV